IMGRVSDLYGRRPVFLICLALFVVGSVWAALATSLWPMVAARVVQALGGGAMVPVALAAISDAVPVARRPLAIGMIAAVDTAGWVAGPTYGAWLTTWLGWRWVFWLNVPIGLIAALLVAVALPRSERTRHRLDLVGGALLTLFLLAFTTALYLGAPASPEGGALLANSGTTERSPWFWPLLGLSVLMLAAFAWRERRAAEPLIAPRLLVGRLFASAHSVSLLTGIILMAVMVEIPVLLQALSPTIEEAIAASGWLLGVFAGSMMAGALGAGPLQRFIGPRWLTLGGLLLSIGGLWQMAAWQQPRGADALYLPLALAGLGLGLVTTAIASAILGYVAEEQRGIAASLLLVARLIGMTLGLSVLVTWALRRFEALRAQVPPPPGGLGDPNALAYITQKIGEIMTIVVTDLFLVTAVVAVVAVVPALALSAKR
ncbi:MAG: MFS transporter, partial [Ardenticatenaceae bacterium]